MNEIVKANDAEIIKAAQKSGDLKKVLSALQKESDAQETQKVVRLTKQDRIDAWKADKETMDLLAVQDLETRMERYVSDHYLDRVQMDEQRALAQEEVDTLAAEMRDLQVIEDFVASRRQHIRSLVFASLDETLGDDPETPAGQKAGHLDSEIEGLKFCREGGKRKAASIDWSKIEKALGDSFHDVCDVREVPAHTEYVPNEDALMEKVVSGQISMETLREALIPGSFTTPRFVVRPL